MLRMWCENISAMKKVFAIFFVLLLFVTAGQGAKLKKAVKMANMSLSSPVFGNNEKLPVRFTGDGEGQSPPLAFRHVPKTARSLALILDDPDVPIGTFTHWLIWNISPGTAGIKEGTLPAEAVEGKNTIGRTKYVPPRPPSGTHRYIFRLYALDSVLALEPGADREGLENALQGHIISQAELIGKYR